jgi:hypothetical protein
MANKYLDILNITANGKNQMGLSNTIKRDYGIPLDFTSVQESYDAAVAYAATSTLAYVGQTVAVGAKLYIISDVANGTHTVGEGDAAKTYDNYLAEVGSKTEGDGNTIELDGQTLKLAGLTNLDNSKTYVPSLVNGKLVWAEPDTSTAEGQAQEINALKARASELEATVNGKAAVGEEGAEGYQPAVVGLTEKVAANTQAIADEKSAREAAIGVPASEGVEASGVYAAIAEALQDAKDYADANDADTIYNDADVRELIGDNAEAIEALEGAVANVYTKTEVDDKFTAVNNTIAGLNHFTTKIVESTDAVTEVGVLYLIKDEAVAGVDKYNEYLFIEGNGAVLIGDTTTDLSDYVTNDALTQAITEFVTNASLATTLSEYAKTADVNTALDLKANAADVVANGTFEAFQVANTEAIAEAKKAGDDAAEALETYKGENATALGGKADKATTLAGYGITDAYTKAETVAKTDVYTKTEIDKLLDDVSGGSSETAASVKRALDGYIQNMDTEVYGADVVASWTSDENGYVPQYTVADSRIDKAVAAVATAQAQADKGVSDAAAAQSKADEAAVQAGTNKTDIAALTTQIANRNQFVDQEIAALKAADTTITGDIAGLKTTTESHSTSIGDHAAAILALQNKDTELAGQIAGHISAVDTKFADYYTAAQVDAKVKEVSDAVGAIDLAPYAKQADVDSALALKANTADVYTKSEADAEFMTESEVDARINALIVGADPEGGKAITDIQNLVKYVDENAGEIAALVTASSANTAKLAGIDGTVVAYVEAQLKSVVTPKASAEVTVAEDGTLGLGEVSTDKLVQGTKTLVLYGGDAEVAVE